MHTFPFPKEVLYLIVKNFVLIMVMIIWLAVTASKAT